MDLCSPWSVFPSTAPACSPLRVREVLPIYSSLPQHLQKKVFEPAPQPRFEGGPMGRKVRTAGLRATPVISVIPESSADFIVLN